MDTPHKILGPILSVFGAEDGGVSFAILRHKLLPEIIEKSETNESTHELLECIKKFSRLCELIYDNK